MVGPRALGLSARVIDVLDREGEFILVPLWIAAVFATAVGQSANTGGSSPPVTSAPDDEAGSLHRLYLEEAHRVLRRPTQGMISPASTMFFSQAQASLAC
jgi:hypothetical protein